MQAGTTFRDGFICNNKYLGKALGLLTMNRKYMMRPNSIICRSNIKADYQLCMRKELSNFVYVEYNDVLGEDGAPNDSVDNMLDFKRLQLERREEDK